nr:MAG: hypothetical protein DIU78_16565 [Pseudomonadota bacterium]
MRPENDAEAHAEPDDGMVRSEPKREMLSTETDAEARAEPGDEVVQGEPESEMLRAEVDAEMPTETDAEAHAEPDDGMVRSEPKREMLSTETDAEAHAEPGDEVVRGEPESEMSRAEVDAEMPTETDAEAHAEPGHGEMQTGADGEVAPAETDGETVRTSAGAEVLRVEADGDAAEGDAEDSKDSNQQHRGAATLQHTHVGQLQSIHGRPTRESRPTLRLVSSNSRVSNRERQPASTAQCAHVGELRAHAGPLRSAMTAATPIAAATHLRKATQTIAPAVRRHVYHRDRGRCVVPGCNFGGFLDIHHLNPRAEGGGHHPENLVTLCQGHHSLLHTGQLAIEGSPSTGLRFLRADGTEYTDLPSARAVAVGKQVFGALRRLGFSERHARSAVRRALEAVETPCAATLLRAALSALTTPHG